MATCTTSGIWSAAIPTSFETAFNYDEVLELPRPQSGQVREGIDAQTVYLGAYEHLGTDALVEVREERIGPDGMRINRMFFDHFADAVRGDQIIAAAVEAGQWDRVINYVNREIFDKPEEYYILDKLRAAVDRRLTLREILEKVFDLIPCFKSKDELLKEEFAKFVADHKPAEAESIAAIKTYFKAYATSGGTRDIIDRRHFPVLATNAVFSLNDFRAVPAVPHAHS